MFTIRTSFIVILSLTTFLWESVAIATRFVSAPDTFTYLLVF